MSTSISLTVSADQQEAATSFLPVSGAIGGVTSATAAPATKTSKSYCDLRKSANNNDYGHHNHPQLNDQRYHNHQLLQPHTFMSKTPEEAAGLPLERRHTGPGSEVGGDKANFLQFFDSSKLKRWRHHHRRDNSSDSNDERDDEPRVPMTGAPRGADFYQEVDERMSCNSMEYPQHQAKYVNKWLDENNNNNFSNNFNRTASSFRSKSFEEDADLGQLRGNVIGIRGFSSESLVAESKRFQESYNKLRGDYLRLLSDYNKLRRKSGAADDKDTSTAAAGAALTGSRSGSRKRDTEMAYLKSLLARQSKRLDEMAAAGACHQHYIGHCDECRRRAEQAPAPVTVNCVELDRCQHELRRLELALEHQKQQHEAIVSKLRSDNDQLKARVGERDSELANLRVEVKNLSLEPNNRRYLNLCHENERLKDDNDRELNEYQLLKVKYDKLEARLKSLCEDHKCMSQEHSDEFKRLMVELCRLQVYQPKLEMLLDTECKIKGELQRQIERLSGENQRLGERVAELDQELAVARMQANAKQSGEIDKFVAEAAAWQDKCQRLKEEKASLEAAVQSNKMKVAQLDARLHDELDRAREACRAELNRALAQVRKCESENNELVVKVGQLSGQVDEYKSERETLRGELMALHRELQLTKESAAQSRPKDQLVVIESMSQRAKQCEQDSDSLRSELKMAQLANNELANELKLAQNKVDHYSRQLADQKRRFDMQQKAFDELRDRKDKELAKLRADLNFESYNRQVALRGIEKELRSSLRELEVMKCRFASAKRLNVSCDNSIIKTLPSSSSPTTTTTTGAATTEAGEEAIISSSNTNRVVQFDIDQQSSGTTTTSTTTTTTMTPASSSTTVPSDLAQQRPRPPSARILSRPARASKQ